MTDKLKVLWVEMGDTGYKGAGWISSLRNIVNGTGKIELGVTYITSHDNEWFEKDGTKFYPIYRKAESSITKILRYYGIWKRDYKPYFLKRLQEIISDFAPDIIHLFGIENELSCVLDVAKKPQVVHLQGVLSPYQNAYFPSGISLCSFMWPPSVNEWVLRNGYVYRYRLITKRAEAEKKLFKKVKYCMGRTDWDKEIAAVFAPQAEYYHVDESLREVFYEKANAWMWHKHEKKVIVSTISAVPYKGLDIILKTASSLINDIGFDFEWRVVGLNQEASMVSSFEHAFDISSKDVNVKYLGVLDENKLCEELLNADIYVHPSYIDNSPNSVCEAQMLGVPVIASNVGGVKSLIPDGAGLLYPANGIYELSYMIVELSRNSNLAKEISRKEVEVALKRHNKERVLSQLMDTYTTVLKCTKNGK